MRGLLGFAVLMALQLICGGFLLWDVLSGLLGFRFPPIDWAIYALVEIGAITGLLLWMIVSASLLWRAIQRKKRVENSLRLASGAFMDVLDESFTDWRLTRLSGMWRSFWSKAAPRRKSQPCAAHQKARSIAKPMFRGGRSSRGCS